MRRSPSSATTADWAITWRSRRTADPVIAGDAQRYGRPSWGGACDRGLGRGERRCCPRNSGERRVDRGPDVAVDLRRVWAFEHALGEHDDGQVLGRVNQPGGAQSAVPAERAAVVDRLAEPPRPAVEEPRQKAPGTSAR